MLFQGQMSVQKRKTTSIDDFITVFKKAKCDYNLDQSDCLQIAKTICEIDDVDFELKKAEPKKRHNPYIKSSDCLSESDEDNASLEKYCVIYILECAENKIYVGRSVSEDAANRRFEQHKSGISKTAWTSKYPAVRMLHMYCKQDYLKEEYYTFLMMNKYGVDNVRGGCCTSICLKQYQTDYLNDMLRNQKDLCFKCFKPGHFRDCCPNYNNG